MIKMIKNEIGIFQGSANPLIMKVKACVTVPYNSILPKSPKSYKLILKLDDIMIQNITKTN
jgi:hypothetical protein